MTEQQIISLCEKGDFAKAISAIDESIILPENRSSNIYRLRGQINMELGNIDESINDLIEALKVEPKNIEALTLIGNIYGGTKNDIDTAMTYYGKVLDLRPTDHLAISNIASINAKAGKFKEAIELFNKALDIKPKFGNALYGKALSFFHLGQYSEAFECCTITMKSIKPLNSESKSILSFSLELMKEMGSLVAKEFDQYPKRNTLLEQLQKLSNKPIVSVIDESIPTPAKIEIAEYRNQEEHIIKYKTDNPLHHHLLYHELMHLKLVFEARAEDSNELFVSNSSMFSKFKIKYSVIEKNLIKKGLPTSYADTLYRQLFDGLNLQLYNAPIDLFIEDYIYNNYPELRPIQFLSLLQMIETIFQGADSKELKGLVPERIRDTNIILAIPQIMHFKDLFGIDLTSRIKEKHLLNKGAKLYGNSKN
jgi:tetratricopeptide (TPR) repeat protein